MAQNFLGCDREQALLMPPSLREWLPADHLAWFVLDAVGEMDLRAFYAAYRQDGWGRAAHDPAMMVALLVYAYAVGERSARGVERRCREDVAFRVITANQVPDHATIARFRVRHEDALAGLFGEVLRLCAEAGAVSVGVIAVDGTRVKANAADRANFTYEQLAREILAEADAIDAAEDEQFGERRGDELPPELGDPNTRRARLREAKRRLDADREAKQQEMEAWKVAKAEYTARTGRTKIGAPPKPRPVAPVPAGRINVTDPDSRPVKTARGFVQGYTAQAVATAEQIVIAADVITGGNERHRLEPMVRTACEELRRAGLTDTPEVVLADAGFWNGPHIEQLAGRGIRSLVKPDAESRKTPTRLRSGRLYEQMRAALADDGRALYRQRQAMIEPVFAHTKIHRRSDRFLRRGLSACRAEWRLITAAHNLRKLWRRDLAPLAA
jgi:transposase